MKIKTMRDVSTIQGLRNQATPTTREQAVTEAARLERELARLKRELDMWTANQNKTTERMQRIEQRLALLGELVEPSLGSVTERSSGHERVAERTEDGRQEKEKGWRTVDLQY
jgi:chromosome segregation ATPase